MVAGAGALLGLEDMGAEDEGALFGAEMKVGLLCAGANVGLLGAAAGAVFGAAGALLGAALEAVRGAADGAVFGAGERAPGDAASLVAIGSVAREATVDAVDAAIAAPACMGCWSIARTASAAIAMRDVA